jgi:hypothetical protein
MASTLQAMVDRQRHPDQVVVAGEVLDLRIENAALSLRAAKMLHLLVRAAGADACQNMRHSVPVSDLNDAFHLSVGEFIDTARELAKTAVELRYTNEHGRNVVKIGPMLADIERDLDAHTDDDPAIVSWEFSPVMRVLLSTSSHWAALSKRAILAFEGRYSLRLYELVSIRGGLQFKRQERFELDDLRRRLGVEPDKLVAWIHFRQRALDPAIAEVNQLSGLEVSYDVQKTGRKVTGILLRWRDRDPEGRAAVSRELETARVGRKARREGTVEQVEAPGPVIEIAFPRFGSVRGTPFEAIARANLPSPMPDIDVVAREFVAWAERSGKPLRGEQVTAMWAGFCKNQHPAR